MNTRMLSKRIPLAIVRGRPVYRILGAEDVPAGQSAAGTPESGQSATTPATEADGGQSAPEAETVSRAEFDRLQNQLRAADQKRQEAEKARKDLEDKDLDELEKTKNQAKELEQSVQSLNSQVSQLRLENAFLKDSTYSWHDPSDVLRFVKDDDSVSIGDDGKVTGMEAALKKLATKKPYLVKTNEAKLPESSSGTPANGGQTANKLDDSRLKAKYRALRDR